MTTEDEIVAKVADRLKFFFSDANIRADRFMQYQMKNHGGRDRDELSGSVAIETLMKFNSIKQHTTSSEMVAKAAKTLGDFLQVTDDDTAIKRVVPFHLSQMNDNLPLSLMVKNLPVEEGTDNKPKYTVTVDQIKELFEGYGEVALIKFRYKPKEDDEEKPADKANDSGDKKDDADKTEDNNENKSNESKKSPAKGVSGGRKKRVFIPAGKAQVEFAKKEDLEKAAAECLTIKAGEDVEPKRTLELGGNTLKVQLLEESIKKKHRTPFKKENGGGADDTSKKRRQDKVEEPFTFDWKPGCVVSLKGLGADGCDREAIREAICKALAITDEDAKTQKIYIDYSRGQPTGAIRFPEPVDQIKQLRDKLSTGEVEIGGNKVTEATLLEGDQEKEYWKNFIDFKNQQMKNNDGHKRRKRHRSR